MHCANVYIHNFLKLHTYNVIWGNADFLNYFYFLKILNLIKPFPISKH